MCSSPKQSLPLIFIIFCMNINASNLLLESRCYSEAVEELLAYEQMVPGRGQTSELLGRAYLALGEYTQAVATFFSGGATLHAVAKTVA